MGHSAATILTAVQSPRRIILFDFFGNVGVDDARAELPQRFPHTSFEFISGHTHLTVREFAKKASADGFHCDIIHIDAGHLKDEALPDILNAKAIASPGGLVLLDDCGCAGAWWCDGVNAAVKQAVTDKVITVISQGEFAWGKKGTCIVSYN